MKGKSWIAWLCAIVTFVQVAAMGLSAGVPGVQAAAADTLTAQDGEIYYYDLANGPYYLSGGTITVNGQVMASGTMLNTPGDYTIVNQITDRNGNPVTSTQYVALYIRADAHPDGVYDVKDLVATKKHVQGIQISKAGQMALEAYNDAYTDEEDKTAMWDVLLESKTVEEAFPKVSAQMPHSSGSSDVMPIGGFLGPGYINTSVYGTQTGALSDYRTDKIYKLVADAGINLLMAIPNKTAEDEYVEPIIQSELALAEKYGLGVYVQPSYVQSQPELLDEYVRELSAYKSFMGITLEDEPNTSYYYAGKTFDSSKTYEKSKALAQKLNQYANLTGYSNLLPYWESMGSEENYKQYLEEYFTQYTDAAGNGPRQLSVDYYVFAEKDTDRNATEYFKTLRIVKEVADAKGVPYWSVVQAGDEVTGNMIRSSQDKSLYMTEGKTLWNVNTSLAYGAKGITYYPLVQPWNYSWRKTYSWSTSPRDDDYNYDRNGVIGADGETTPHYAYIQKANHQIQAVDQVLMNATHKGILVSGTNATNHTAGAVTPAAEARKLQSLVSSNTTAGAMAGCFDYLGNDAYYVVNYDYDAARNVTMTFDGDYALSVTINGETTRVNTANQAYTLSLSAGEAALVVVNNAVDTGEAQAVIDAISAIPENAAMPMYYTKVLSTKRAYDAMSKFGKQSVSAALVEKLNNLVRLTTAYTPVYEEALQAGGTAGVLTVDPDYGNVTELTVSGANAFTDGLNALALDYSHVVFYVYNPGEAVNATYGDVAVRLAAGWTMVEVPAGQVGNNLSFASPVSGTWKVTRFYGKNDSNMVTQVTRAIENLPEAASLTLADKQAVEAALALYNALDDTQKAEVTNAAKLTDCEKKLQVLPLEALIDVLPAATDLTIKDLVALDRAERAYDALDESLYSVISSAKAEKLTACLQAMDGNSVVLSPDVGTADSPVETTAYTAGTAQDSRFGTVFTLDYTSAANAGFRLNGDMSGYANRYFYIYNPTETVATAWMYYDNDWKSLPVTSGEYSNGLTMNPGWNKVTLPDFDGSAYELTKCVLGNFDIQPGQWKITAVYSSTAAGAEKLDAAQIEAQIQALPAATDLGGSDKDAVNAANTAYTGLSTTAQSYISQESKDKLTACVAKLAEWKVWEDKTLVDVAQVNMGVDGTTAINVDDNRFGKVMTVSGNATCIKIPGSLLSGDAVDLYIHNPTGGAVSGYYVADGDWSNSVNFTLAESGWNLVHIQKTAAWQHVSDQKDIYVYLSFGTDTWLISSVYSAEVIDPEADAIAAVNQQIVGLPAASALKVSDKEAVNAAKNAYAQLSDTAKAKVENYAKVEQCLEKIAQWDALDAKTLVNVAQVSMGVDGTTAINVDDNRFGKVMTVSGNATCIKIPGSLLSGDAVDLYIHNPTGGAVSGYYVADGDWGNSVNFTLAESGWNLVHIQKTAAWQHVSDQKDIYVYLSFGTNTWLVSSVYSAEVIDPEADAIAAVNQQIVGLPAASALKVSDKEAVNAAKNAYAQLSDTAKAKVENYAKVEQCLEKIAQWDALDAKTLVDVAQVSMGVDGTTAINVDDNRFGKVMTVSGNATCIKIPGSLLSGDAVDLYIHNPTGGAVSGYYVADGDWGNSVNFTLAESGWNLVHIQKTAAWQHISDQKDIYVYLSFGTNTWLISSVYSAEVIDLEADAITAVNQQIADLSEANALTVSDKQAVRDAETAYNALSTEGKAQVVGKDKLDACLEKVNYWDALAEKTVLDLATVAVTTGHGDIYGSLTPGVDNNTFGKVGKIAASEEYIVVEPGRRDDRWKASTAVGFYVFNPTDSDVSAYYTMDWKYNQYVTLKANAWTYVEFKDFTDVPSGQVGDFVTSSTGTIYFYAAFSGDGWLISSFYSAPVPAMPGAGSTAAVVAVNAQIEALPEATALTEDHKDAVREAETAYNALGADKAQVDNAAKLEACIAKVNFWEKMDAKKVIDVTTGIESGVTVSGQTTYFNTVASVADNTFGTVTGFDQDASFVLLQKNDTSKACTAVGIYIYNPTDEVKSGYYTMDWNYNVNFTLQPNSWNLIVLTDMGTEANQQFVTSANAVWFYVNFASGWKISNGYTLTAEEEAAAAVNNAAAALPAATALTAQHKSSVTAAKTAYDALSETAKELVLYADNLEACVQKVASWDEMEAKKVIDVTTGIESGVTVSGQTTYFNTVAGVADNTFGTVTGFDQDASFVLLQKNDTSKACTAVGIYIYNPTDEVKSGYYTMDWNYNVNFTLQPNSWNLIELTDMGTEANQQFVTSANAVWFYVNFASGWKISNGYKIS